MYFYVIYVDPKGNEKRIEMNNYLKFIEFGLKLSRHAKKENKLKQVITDNFFLLSKLREQLPGVKVSYGFKEDGKLCVLE